VNGSVDHSGRALVVLSIRRSAEADATGLTAWVDTAFTGDLVIPRHIIESLGLQQSAAVTATLADSTEVVLETFACVVEWFGRQQLVEVVQSNGQVPLLGVGLLCDRRLEIDYRSQTVVIE
jgi:clan AA aspartic protease